MATPPVFLPEKSHGQRSLEGYNSCCKESDTTEHLSIYVCVYIYIYIYIYIYTVFFLSEVFLYC